MLISDVGSTSQVTTYIKELTTSGSVVQTIELSPYCKTTLNPYAGAPHLSTDGQLATLMCFNENNAHTVGIVNPSGFLNASTTFSFGTNQNLYRALKDGEDIYIAGDYIGTNF